MREDSQNLPLLDALMRHYDELVEHVRRRFGDKNFAHEVVHEVYMHVVNVRPHEQEGKHMERAMSAIRPAWSGVHDDIGATALREPMAGRFPSREAIAGGATKRRVVRKIAAMTALLLLSTGIAWLKQLGNESLWRHTSY